MHGGRERQVRHGRSESERETHGASLRQRLRTNKGRAAASAGQRARTWQRRFQSDAVACPCVVVVDTTDRRAIVLAHLEFVKTFTISTAACL